MQNIITTSISTIKGLIIAYIVRVIANYKKRDNVQNIALRNILKSNLVNQYYVYADIGSVPRYIKDAWYDMFESYTSLGGNSFVKHDIEPKFAQLKIKD